MPKKVWVRLLLIISFFIPFLLSLPVWFSKRDFPVTPFIIKPIEFSCVIDVMLLVVFGLLAVYFILREKGKGGLFFFLLYVVFCILDQTRIQPFFFEISILVFFYYLFRNDLNRFKIAFLLLMAGTYIWSGLHKINPTFFNLWLNGLNRRIPFVPQILREGATYVIPFLEMSFGIALLFNKTRKHGIFLLAVMHALVLITLLIGGSGFTVVPLNIVNVLLLFMLGYNLNWNLLSLKSSQVKIKIIAVYALFLPSLNLIGVHDHLLSFSYFSGKPSYGNIFFNDDKKLDKLPQKIKEVLRVHNDINYINLNEWSVKYVNVLCYPEDRVYLYLQEFLESYTGQNTTTLQYYKN